MPTFAPGWMAGVTGGRWTQFPAERIRGFSHDSRRLRPGEAFVAVAAAQRDGHDFIAGAREAGAAAAVVSRPVEDPLPQLVVPDAVRAFGEMGRRWRGAFLGPLVGITGSCGKTSTKNLLARLLGERRVYATEGNLNNHLGVPLTLLGLDPLAADVAVCEAGMNAPGEIGYLGRLLEPTAGLVTMVGAAHLEKVGSLDGIAREKAALLHTVAPGGWVAFPASCLQYQAFRDLERPRQLVAFSEADGILAEAHRQADDTVWIANLTEDALSLRSRDDKTNHFALPPMSAGMQQNAALAVVMALRLGASPAFLAEALRTWEPESRRGSWSRTARQTFFVDCYNANPPAMRDSLTHFAAHRPAGPALFVLGTMEELGPEAAEYHQNVAQHIPLRTPEDAVLFIGPPELTAAYAQGLSSPHVCGARDAAEARPIVERFGGAIFLKGSRTWQLETLVPGDAVSFSPGKQEVAPC